MVLSSQAAMLLSLSRLAATSVARLVPPVVRAPRSVINRSMVLQQMRSSSSSEWHYRSPQPNVAKSHKIAATVIMGIAWYWILFHFWYDIGHVTGHFPYPDPSQWTNEELGIPPDDED